MDERARSGGRGRTGSPGLDAASGWSREAIGRPMLTRWGAHVAFWVVYFVVRSAAATSHPPAELAQFPFLINRIFVVLTYGVLTCAPLALVLGPLARSSALTRNLVLVCGVLALTPLTLWGEQTWPKVLAPGIDAG